MSKFNVGDVVRVQFSMFFIFCLVSLGREGRTKLNILERGVPGSMWFDPSLPYNGELPRDMRKVEGSKEESTEEYHKDMVEKFHQEYYK